MRDRTLAEKFKAQVESELAELRFLRDSLKSVLCAAGVAEIDITAPTDKESFILESFDYADNAARVPYIEAGFSFLLKARALSRDETNPIHGDGGENWVPYKGALVMFKVTKDTGSPASDAVLSFTGESSTFVSSFRPHSRVAFSVDHPESTSVGRTYLDRERQQFLESFAVGVLRLGGPDITSGLASVMSVTSESAPARIMATASRQRPL